MGDRVRGSCDGRRRFVLGIDMSCRSSVAPDGVPRPLLFGLMVVGIGAHLSVVRFLTEITGSRLLLTVSLVLLAGGLATGLVRVLWYPGAPPTE